MSFTAKVDIVFYTVAFTALVYFLNRDYGGIVTSTFKSIFPREAAVLFGTTSDEF